MHTIQKRIINNAKTLSIICDDCRRKGKRIVLTTGAYDILHEGHLMYLHKARSLGEILIVGINDDAFVKEIKGPDRPYFPERHRATMVAGLRCVSLVYIFSDRMEIVETVKPDIFVMSETSHVKPEMRRDQQELVKKYGGTVKIYGPMSDFHTSDILKQMLPARG